MTLLHWRSIEHTHRPLHDIQPNIHTLKHGCNNQSLPQGLQVIVCAPMAMLMFRHNSYITRIAISFDQWLLGKTSSYQMRCNAKR